jgi:hypothetical protein
MAKPTNIYFKIVLTCCAILILWDCAARIPAWVALPISFSAPAGEESGISKWSVLLLLLCSSLLAYQPLSLRRHRGFDLFVQAYQNTNHAAHHQAQRTWRFYFLSLFTVTIGRLLGSDWKSGFYVLYVVGAMVKRQRNARTKRCASSPVSQPAGHPRWPNVAACHKRSVGRRPRSATGFRSNGPDHPVGCQGVAN